MNFQSAETCSLFYLVLYVVYDCFERNMSAIENTNGLRHLKIGV
jgi:hypothetical protein